MANVDVNRSIQFVSLDTHPANNALVVTYEILANVLDSTTKRELERRNKRHQIQVKLSVLDKLSENDLRADQLALDLGKLSGEILSKCPLLSASVAAGRRTNLEEEIQLHLLYLINRRRTQLLTPRTGSGASATHRERPPSSLARLRSASGQQHHQASTISGRRLAASGAHRMSINSDVSGGDTAALNSDVYNYLLARESFGESSYNDSMLGIFMDQLDERLSRIETPYLSKQPSTKTNNNIQQDLETQLEGLYGDQEDRLISMATIRQFSKSDENLTHMASNRLLVCALLRTLRDSEIREQHLSESILYCLIWLTTYRDLYKLAFATEKDPIELEKIIFELLLDQVKVLKSADVSNEHKLIEETFYYTNSLLVIMVNQIRFFTSLNSAENINIRDFAGSGFILAIKRPTIRPTTGNERNIVESLVDLVQLLAKHLARCVRFVVKLEATLLQLNNLILILRQLSIFKDFVCQLGQQGQFVDSLIGLLNTLQLSRPGSGSQAAASSGGQQQQQQQQQFVTDKQILKQLYLLEMDLLKLINNLMFDQRLKLRFIRKKLLKCVLRNLVVLMANTCNGQHEQQNTLKPYQNSWVLMVPFKCLYELSCHELVKGELYKSKIIIKCLLEFLLSSTMDLKQALEFKSQLCSLKPATVQQFGGVGSNSLLAKKSTTKKQLPPQTVAGSKLEDLDDQIVLEADCADHYILSLWANLSSKADATIYGKYYDPDLMALVGEYVHLNLLNLRLHLQLQQQQQHNQQLAATTSGYRDNGKQQQQQHDNHYRLLVYLHSKVLRNMSQFMKRPETVENATYDGDDEPFRKWTQQLSSILAELTASPEDLMSPLIIESLATLSNLLALLEPEVPDESSEQQQQQQVMGMLSPLIERLFKLDCGNLSAENDDFLLVSTLLMANIARKCEICNRNRNGKELKLNHNNNNDGNDEEEMSLKIIETSNFILESRTGTDHEMIISCLYALGHFMNHSNFLQNLSRQLDIPNGSIERLVGRLASLVLNCSVNSLLARLSILLLNNLRQLEQQLSIESLVYNRRFATYNNKWLSAIKSSGEMEDASDMMGTSGGAHWTLENGDLETGVNYDNDDNDDDNSMGNDDEDEDYMVGDPSQLRAYDSESNGSQSSSLRLRQQQQQPREGSEPEEDSYGYEDDDDDDDDEDDDSSLVAPDLNVIDSNSMIKHLTSRRQLRTSSWLDGSDK